LRGWPSRKLRTMTELSSISRRVMVAAESIHGSCPARAHYYGPRECHSCSASSSASRLTRSSSRSIRRTRRRDPSPSRRARIAAPAVAAEGDRREKRDEPPREARSYACGTCTRPASHAACDHERWLPLHRAQSTFGGASKPGTGRARFGSSQPPRPTSTIFDMDGRTARQSRRRSPAYSPLWGQ
jgi:hypothetical protein